MSDAEECISGFVHLSFESQFAKVIFQDVKEYYNTSEDVECVFTLTSQSAPQNGDKVALFKVGWSNTKDFLASEDVIPSATTSGDDNMSNDSRIKVVFKADFLPKDDSEFYQFCYLVSDGNILGASTPFSFKSTIGDELVSVEDAENDLLIIRTKSAMREELVREISQQKDQLQMENGMLAAALGGEKQKQKQLEKEFQDKITELGVLNDKARTDFEESAIRVIMDELQVESSLNGGFKEAVLAAKRKQNVLESCIENLKKDKELLENRLSASNCELQTHVKKVEALTSEVNMHSKTIVELKRLVTVLEQSNDTHLARADKAESALGGNETRLNDLMTMMMAMEKSKKMATEEISKSNADAQKSMADLAAKLEDCRDACGKLVLDNKSLQKCLKEKDEIVEDLKNKYLQSQQDATKYKEDKGNLEAAVQELKNRLARGGEEYRRKYLDWYRLNRKYTKLQEKINVQKQIDNSREVSESECTSSIQVQGAACEHKDNEAAAQPIHSLDPEQKVKILAEMERQLQGFNSSRVPEAPEAANEIEIAENQGSSSAIVGYVSLSYPYPAYYPYPYPNSSVVPFVTQQMREEYISFPYAAVMDTSVNASQCPCFDVASDGRGNNENTGGEGLQSYGGSHASPNSDGFHIPNATVTPSGITCCPVCDIPFVTTLSSAELEAHIADHFTFTCPLCGMQFEKKEGNAMQMFETHVADHFKNEN